MNRKQRDGHANPLRFETLEPRMLLSGDGLTGEYFNSANLTQSAGTRIDPFIIFPADALGNDAQGQVTADDEYSIRWTGFVLADQAGQWQFTTYSNDGVRLWIDDTQIIDNWDQHALERDDGQIQLSAGWHAIRLEYFQQGGDSDLRLFFSGPGQSEVLIPQSHLCTTDPGATQPIADAGPDRLVVLPETSVTLDGFSSDNGQIVSRTWTQMSGPNTASLSGTDTDDLTVSDLVEGTYEFHFAVVDDQANTAIDSVIVNVVPAGAGGIVSGELKQWHKVSVDFQGPTTSETASTNPFTDYRLDVTFTHQGSGKTYTVPGFYAADGNAANTSATAGNVWRVHFAPDEIGDWVYVASFRTGTNVAVSSQANPGVGAGFFDGAAGQISVAATDKSGIDLRGKGRLDYVGERYLQFAGTGEYFLKQGADSPENLLAYDDFDGPFTNDGQGDNFIKDWAPHVADWNPGDPTWAGGKGKGIIGAVNYLASEGQNAFSFLPMNIGGDDKNVFPYLNYNERLRLDVSRLAQWEVLFEHADQKGMFLHFKTQETENDQLLDGGALGNQRKLYYRELVARFSHHLALNWNLGEENTNTTQQRKDFAQFFHDNDPYQHHIVLHTFPGQTDQVYDPLLGNASRLTGASIQTSNQNFSQVHSQTAKWVNDSAATGKPWAVAVDEPGDAQHAIRPDNDAGNSHEDGRKNALWGTLLAGGWGNEYYFGYGHAHSDLTLQDFRSRDDWWDYTRYALEFFEDNDIPFWQMQNDNSISTAANDYGFYKTGESYVVYLKQGGTTNLNLAGTSGTYDVRWFDPRNGGALQIGSVSQVSGGGMQNLGTAPNNTNQDWAILVERSGPVGPNQPPQVSINQVNPAPSGEGDVFQEHSGLVVIEMESQPAAGGWQLQTNVPGYTGDGFYRWEGPNLFGNPGAQGVTQYKINVTNPGTYQMRFHNHRNGGIPFDQENDIWTRMDNDQWIKVFSSTQGQWNWASNFDFGEGNRPSASYNLSAGEHTFTISGRSTGFRVDRVVFYNTALTAAGTAQNLSTPQSPRGGEPNDLAFQLNASVFDDGQVLTSPQLQWTLESGPGTAEFSEPQNASTEVEFSTPGIYVVKLGADDGEFQASARHIIIAPLEDSPSGEETFSPVDDATVQGTAGINDGVIKVQTSGPVRTGYFKFDVSGIDSGDILGAKLRLTVSEDAGSGTLNLYQGTTNSWSETNINSTNAPGQGALIDSVGGTHSLGQVVEFDLSSAITGNGTYTFVLKHGGGNDVWFSSKEGSAAPELVVDLNVGTNLPGDFNGDNSVDAADYTVWQDLRGATVSAFGVADGSGNGVIDQADYTIWRQNYGMTAPPATAHRVMEYDEPPATAPAFASLPPLPVYVTEAQVPATRTLNEAELPALRDRLVLGTLIDSAANNLAIEAQESSVWAEHRDVEQEEISLADLEEFFAQIALKPS